MSEYEKADKKKEEKKELYTDEDYKRFCDAMKDFKGNLKVNDTLYSPFERYLHSLGVIRFNEISRFTVKDATGYTKLSAMNARYDLREYYKDEEFMRQNPEARTAFQERIAKLREKLNFKVEAQQER